MDATHVDNVQNSIITIQNPSVVYILHSDVVQNLRSTKTNKTLSPSNLQSHWGDKFINKLLQNYSMCAITVVCTENENRVENGNIRNIKLGRRREG